MPPTSDTELNDPVAEVFEALFIRAWNLFDADKYDDVGTHVHSRKISKLTSDLPGLLHLQEAPFLASSRSPP
jgi:hypothetical protein